MISFDRARKKLVLRQFYSEGFVNEYVAEPTPQGTLQFVSESLENILAGYRARESYQFTGKDAFVETFEIAEPGKDYTIYSQTRFKRK